MAKTTKRIVSLVIVAMLLAAMVPFTAFAETPSLTLSMTKDGFTYTVYQVATLDTTTGGYTLKTEDAGIVAAMKTKDQSGADFLAALDAASDPGDAAGTVSKGSDFTTSTMGIYYAKATAWPDGVQRKSNTVVVPQYNKDEKTWKFSSASIDLSTNGKAVSERVLDNTNAYLAAYAMISVVSFLILCLDGQSVGTTLSAVLATFNNIGPGIEAVGPTCNYAFFSDLSKVTLIFNMLAGRLEIFPMLILFSRQTWKK